MEYSEGLRVRSVLLYLDVSFLLSLCIYKLSCHHCTLQIFPALFKYLDAVVCVD